MKKRKLLAIIGSISILLGTQSCAYMDSQSSSSSAAAEAAAEIDKAKSMGYEWRDSRKILEKAEKALAAGDTEKADKLFAEAKQQGIDAQKQAKAQSSVAGPH